MEPVNERTLEWSETAHGSTSFRRKQLGRTGGGENLGASLYELPPGKQSWPYHYHTGNEEAIYVLAGEGTLRVGSEDEWSYYPLRAGDYVALPAGSESAHQVANTEQTEWRGSDGGADTEADGARAPLRYLVFSTMNEPDISVYPDSEKLGLFAGAAPGGDSNERVVDGYYPRDAAVDYWKGEE
jgi:uncharacterized cupin superfamily protein